MSWVGLSGKFPGNALDMFGGKLTWYARPQEYWWQEYSNIYIYYIYIYVYTYIYMARDQYLWFHTIFRGWTSILTQLFWCELQGYKVLTHGHTNHRKEETITSYVFLGCIPAHWHLDLWRDPLELIISLISHIGSKMNRSNSQPGFRFLCTYCNIFGGNGFFGARVFCWSKAQSQGVAIAKKVTSTGRPVKKLWKWVERWVESDKSKVAWWFFPLNIVVNKIMIINNYQLWLMPGLVNSHITIITMERSTMFNWKNHGKKSYGTMGGLRRQYGVVLYTRSIQDTDHVPWPVAPWWYHVYCP